MNSAADWIDSGLPTAPMRLRGVMAGAVQDQMAEAATPAAVIGGAAMALYEEVIAGAGGRDDALTLLAADALLTHAFGLQAESDPGDLLALASRLGGRGEIGMLGDRAAQGDR